MLLKKGIIFGKEYLFYKKIINNIYKDIRWAIGCMYFKGKVVDNIPKKKIIYSISNFSAELLHIVGYIKIKGLWN